MSRSHAIIILNRKLSGSDTFCCYVDFKKAFDSVNRERLWDKLTRYGINGPFLSTLQSLHEEYQCCVEVNGNCTPWFEVNNGVKQGCILSPSLFNLYINDLLKKLGRLGFGVHVGCDGREVGVPALRELLRSTCRGSTEGWKSCWPRTCCKT